MSEFDPNVNTPAPSESGVPAQAPITPASNAPAAITPNAAPAATQAPATGAVPEGYVPSYRVRETREAAIRESQARIAQIERAYQERLEQVQNQIKALVGVTPPENPQVETIRNQFFTLFPWAKKLEERSTDLDSLFDRVGDFDQQSRHYWESHARSTMDRLYSLASETLGGPLTEEGKRSLHSSFIGFVQSSPEMEQRYEQDPSLVEDFWRTFSASLIEPVKRQAAVSTVNRVPQGLPQDTPGGGPRTTPAPAPQNMDQRVDAAWALYEQLKRK